MPWRSGLSFPGGVSRARERSSKEIIEANRARGKRAESLTAAFAFRKYTQPKPNAARHTISTTWDLPLSEQGPCYFRNSE